MYVGTLAAPNGAVTHLITRDAQHAGRRLLVNQWEHCGWVRVGVVDIPDDFTEQMIEEAIKLAVSTYAAKVS